jgi:hypothetical protein
MARCFESLDNGTLPPLPSPTPFELWMAHQEECEAWWNANHTCWFNCC